MAIAEMKKLRLVLPRSKKEEFLKELQRCSSVEISEIKDEELPSAELALLKEDADTGELKSQLQVLSNALVLLNRYVPAKTPLLSEKPVVEKEVLLSQEGIDKAAQEAANILNLENSIKQAAAEESSLRMQLESLVPWENLDMPVDMTSTARCEIRLGMVGIKESTEAIEASLAELTECVSLVKISSDKSKQYVMAVCLKEDLDAVMDALHKRGFIQADFSGHGGSPAEIRENINAKLTQLALDKENYKNRITEAAGCREEIKLAIGKAGTLLDKKEAENLLLGTESCVVMKGWLLAKDEAKMAEFFEDFGCAYEISEPEEAEYGDVPVKLENNAYTDAMNMVTNMYSLPAYGTVDANPSMSFFFVLIYGLMMADIGYGIIMIIAAIVALKKIKPEEGTLSFCRLLLYGGISTVICGFLTGGFFGDAPKTLVHMFNPESTWEGLPALFSPTEDSTAVLVGAMVLGLVHLNFGMLINFRRRVKNGDALGAFFDEGAQWILLLGLILIGLNAGFGVPAKQVGIAACAAGGLILLFGSMRSAKGFGKLTAPFSCIYNQATGWFGDILSYSRIMALMLAGGVVAQVFNSIAAMPAQSMGITPVSIIAFLLIFLIGHALNFGLNLLGCFVHDLRLQCLEFFGKFYEDGGKPFRPLKATSKFAKVK